MLSLLLDDRDFKNPVKDWLVEHHPVIMDVVGMLYIDELVVRNIGPKRMSVFFKTRGGTLVDERYARLRGVTSEQLKSFDAAIDSDLLVLILNWKLVPFSFEEEMEA